MTGFVMTTRLSSASCLGFLLGSLAYPYLSPAQGQPGLSPLAPAADRPAPIPKSLTDADARRVEALNKTIDQLRRAGQFTEAIEPAKQILAICEKALGPDHWQTADARREIDPP